MNAPSKRHISFLTGTRAELGLMLRTLAAIQSHPNLELSIIATGMHLDPRSNPDRVKLSALKAAGLTPTAVIPWPPCVTPAAIAEATAFATAHLVRTYSRLNPDIVLVVGDRVEAFAAATAAHLSRYPVAHVHGGDKAEGQLDDSLRHAITKLAHLHFAATEDSAKRIKKLGESPNSIHIVGAPGVEAIAKQAATKSQIKAQFPQIQKTALVLLHPTTPNAQIEEQRALELLNALQSQIANRRSQISQTLLLLPNNDPGNEGIHRAWKSQTSNPNSQILSDLPRPLFLGLLRDCRLLVGNSSAGIIEAASFNTPVLNLGPRQSGRLHGPNVLHANHSPDSLSTTLNTILSTPKPKVGSGGGGGGAESNNPYEQKDTAKRIAQTLANAPLTHPAPPKLITY